MPNRKLTRDLSLANIDKVFGYNDRLAAFLQTLTVDVPTFMDDFLGAGSTLPVDVWTTTNGGGAAAASFVYNAQAGGAARGTTGTANGATSVAAMTSMLAFQGQLNVVMEARVKCSLITGAKMEVGLIDTLTVNGTTVPPDTGAVNVLATPSWNLTGDGVVWAFDTNLDTNWRGLGIKGGVTTTAANMIAPGIAPVAATYETVGIAQIDDNAYFYHKATNGRIDYTSAALAIAVTKTVSLTPWFFVQGRNITSKTMDVDYVKVWQLRNTGT